MMKNSRGLILESLHGRVLVQFQLGSIGAGPVRDRHFQPTHRRDADAPQTSPEPTNAAGLYTIAKCSSRISKALRPAYRFCGAILLIGWACGGCGQPENLSPKVRERSRLSIVREQQGAVRIEGIGPIRGFGQGRDNSFMHCLELVLEAMGRRIGYDELMGLSGMAFRLQFRVDQWDVGNPDPLVGDNRVDILLPVIGLSYDVRVVRRDELAEAAALRREIKKSIDRGAPVLAANIIPPEDWGIITGYQAGNNWVCRSYNGGAHRTDRQAQGWPTAVVLLKKRKPRRPIHKSHVDSIRRAIDLFEKKRSGHYALGRRAFDFWRQDLRGAQDRHYIHANVWTYISLMDARAAAVRYLRSIAKEFGAKAFHILQAADYYEQEVQQLQENYRFVPSARAFPHTLPPREFRQRQGETLLRAKSLEENAIKALRLAL